MGPSDLESGPINANVAPIDTLGAARFGDSMASGRIISSDGALTAAQRETLRAVLDMIIPASGDGRFPSAADVDVLDHIRESTSRLLPALREDLGRLDKLAAKRSGSAFAQLTDSDRVRVAEEIRRAEPDFLKDLALQAATCYYQDDRVLRALGVEARPPFPKGYEVVSGDLSLLDPVRKRGKLYRDTP